MRKYAFHHLIKLIEDNVPHIVKNKDVYLSEGGEKYPKVDFAILKQCFFQC